MRLPQDRIEVDGSPLEKSPAIYLVMNKPRGVVTTASDEKGRQTVYDLLEPGLPWVGPVGRLDKASEGLLLLTNDSEWAAKITDPATHLDKKYHVQVDWSRTPICSENHSRKVVEARRRARRNLRAKERAFCGTAIRTAGWRSLSTKARTGRSGVCSKAWMFKFLRLVRVSIGPLELGDLKKGSTRRLTAEEKKAIDRALT